MTAETKRPLLRKYIPVKHAEVLLHIKVICVLRFHMKRLFIAITAEQ